MTKLCLWEICIRNFHPHLRNRSSVFLFLRKINILQSLLIRCVGRIKYKINSWNSYTTKTKTREAPVYVAHVKKEIMIRYMDIYASLKLRHLFIKLWSPIKKILSHKIKKILTLTKTSSYHSHSPLPIQVQYLIITWIHFYLIIDFSFSFYSVST